MGRKRYMPEQIIRHLRQAEVLSSRGRSVSEICREIFYTLKETQILIEQWRSHYNEVRPQSSLGYRPPTPQAMITTKKTNEEQYIKRTSTVQIPSTLDNMTPESFR